MQKKILFGSITATILLVLVSFSPSITADVDKPKMEVIEEDNPTPIVLVLQLITKLRNHKDIQSVETEDEVLQIIESDEKLNGIFKQMSVYDCGCSDETTEWGFPIICLLLFPFIVLAGVFFYRGLVYNYVLIVITIASAFNCIEL